MIICTHNSRRTFRRQHCVVHTMSTGLLPEVHYYGKRHGRVFDPFASRATRHQLTHCSLHHHDVTHAYSCCLSPARKFFGLGSPKSTETFLIFSRLIVGNTMQVLSFKSIDAANMKTGKGKITELQTMGHHALHSWQGIMQSSFCLACCARGLLF